MARFEPYEKAKVSCPRVKTSIQAIRMNTPVWLNKSHLSRYCNCFAADQRHNGCLVLLHKEVEMLCWYYVDWIPNLAAGACCPGKRWGGECQHCMWHSSNGRHFISVSVNVIKSQVNSSCYLNTESHLTSLDCSICSGATSVCFRSSGWSRVGWGCFSWLRYTIRLRRFLNRCRLLAVLTQWPDLNRMKRPKFLLLGSRLRYRLYAWIRLCGWIRAICPDTVIVLSRTSVTMVAWSFCMKEWTCCVDIMSTESQIWL